MGDKHSQKTCPVKMVLASWFYSTPPQKWTTFETGFGCAKQPANKLHWHRPQIEEVSEKPLGISWDAGSTEVPCHPGPFNMFLKPIHGIPAQANEVNPCKKDMFVHVNPIASIEIILHKHMFTIYIYIYMYHEPKKIQNGLEICLPI